MITKEMIKNKAIELGFDDIGITKAQSLDQQSIDRYKKWLESGCAGEMEYLHRNFEKRINPAKLLDNAKSIICFAYNYKTLRKKQTEISNSHSRAGQIANYALFPDYHKHLKEKLFEIAAFIQNNSVQEIYFKACVDSVPIAEKCFAQKAGLGYFGKNTMLINEKIGTEFFLSELITTLEIAPDAPSIGSCKQCNKCIENCPTKALSENGTLNASKCINYLTIEYQGEIPSDIAKNFGNSLYGCDRCIEVCPMGKNARESDKNDFVADHSKKSLNINEVINWTKKDYHCAIKNSAMERLSFENFKRNAKICLSNSKTKV